MIGRILSSIKETIFPAFCVSCGQEGQWWCKNCIAGNSAQIISCCPGCFKFSANGVVCNDCKNLSPLNGLSAIFLYKNNPEIAKLIKLFKYNFSSDLKNVWKNLFESRQAKLNFLSAGNPAVLPIPLYSSRERERGFNQSKILAEIFSECFNLNLDTDNLVRNRKTLQQAKLSREDRHQNVKDAFVWKSANPAPQNVILIDDVYTTGATMQECAKVLKKHGSKSVRGIVLARD